MLACAEPAFAHDRLFTVESAVLGEAHATAHERERAALRALPAGPRAPVREAEADADPPDEVGAWETELFDVPGYGIHAALLATGRVLLYGYPRLDRNGTGPNNHGEAWIWDPTKGTGHDAFTAVPPPDVAIAGADRPAPIFCSGMSFLPNGDLLVTGGNRDLTATSGISTILTFDPYSERWHRQGDMDHGRWYPSQVLTPQGRVVILGGQDENGHDALNPELEVWPAPGIPVPRDPGAEGIPPAHMDAGDRLTAMYPHLLTMRDGRVALAGPAIEDSGLLDPSTWSWSGLPPLPGAIERIGSNAIPVPGGPDGPQRIQLVGGYDRSGPGPEHLATASTAAIEPGAGSWEATPPQSVGRAYGNTVLLPDATMVTVGGGAGITQSPDDFYWSNGGDERLRHVELWDPATGDWRVGPAQQQFRTYHSIALLLPDGTVLSSGDNYHEDLANGAKPEPWIGNAEIYRPPYLFRGPRPVIGEAPATVLPGERFEVQASGDVERAVLMAPSAVTHGADMSQRHVELRVAGTTSSDGLELVAPPSYAAAPPGQYMLFLLSEDGVPSVARFVRFGLGGDDPLPPDAPAPVSSPAPRGRAGLTAGTAPRIVVEVASATRRSVLRSGRLRVRARASVPVSLELRTALTRVRQVRLAGRARTLSLPLTAAGRRALRRATRRMDVRVRIRSLAATGWVVEQARALLR